AELSAHVAERLQHVGDGGIFRLQSEIRAGQPDLGEAGADWRLAGDERGAARGAALLTVPVGEVAALLRDAIDVGCAIPHDPVVVEADVEPPDVIAPDDEDVRLAGLGHRPLPSLCSRRQKYRSAAGHGLPRAPPNVAGLVSERSPQIEALGEFLRTARDARQRRAQGWQRKYRKREGWCTGQRPASVSAEGFGAA